MDRAGGAPIPCRQRRGGLARSRPGSLARGGALPPLGRGRRASWPAVTPTPSRATAAAATPRRSRRPRGGGAASTPARGKVAAGPPGFFPDGRRRRCRRRCGSDTVRDADAHGAPRASGGGPSQAEEPRPQARAGIEQEVPQREPVACTRTTATGGAAIIGGNTWRHRHCRQSRHRRRRSQASPSTDRSLLSFPPPTGAAEVGMLLCASHMETSSPRRRRHHRRQSPRWRRRPHRRPFRGVPSAVVASPLPRQQPPADIPRVEGGSAAASTAAAAQRGSRRGCSRHVPQQVLDFHIGRCWRRRRRHPRNLRALPRAAPEPGVCRRLPRRPLLETFFRETPFYKNRTLGPILPAFRDKLRV